jgi:GNAT superfamily N-acetyltransferase
MARVRPFDPADREFVVALAQRLTVGIPPWRSEERMRATIQKWIDGSLARTPEKGAIFVAEDGDGKRLGFATVTEEIHFTGEAQAYIGELATAAEAEGQGVGTALVTACEEWARHRGFRLLALATGAGNSRALRFYRKLGFAVEDVKLVKALEPRGPA